MAKRPNSNTFYGHSENPAGKWQTMREHASEVSRLAGEHASYFGVSERAQLAGILHDLGKYAEIFQKRLEGQGSGLDHWSLGAYVAYRNFQMLDVALAIWGHHIGLQNLSGLSHISPDKLALEHPLGLRLTEVNPDRALKNLQSDGFYITDKKEDIVIPKTVSTMLDTRMLFSCLVDADFLDTERHMTEGEVNHPHRPMPPSLQTKKALMRLEAELERLNVDNAVPETTRKMRAGLAELCQRKGRDIAARLWTLTAPTGTGKTLAMLRFALERAMADPRIRRIIVVLPYLSILDQTVDIYHKLFPVGEFGEHYLLEHHSLTLGPQRKDDEQDEYAQEARLLTQNWDSPIVITTSVQLLESLFANRTSACRKLHNLSGSIILMDEVQTLPLPIAIPTLKALSRLKSEKYGTTVVFATATQPAFATLSACVKETENDGWEPQEIVEDMATFYSQARRVTVNWEAVPQAVSWGTVMSWIQESPRSLCIVNLKRHALDLAIRLKEADTASIWHLSTSMCPAHRRVVLEQVRNNLKAHLPCRLISTQCVEAGVDLSFPVVYRALGPLDSIAQAAGRCNRSAELPELGQVVVFRPEDEKYPADAIYKIASGQTAALLKERGAAGMDINEPSLYQAYYHRLYALTDIQNQGKELQEAIRAQDYVTVAKLYRVISNNAANVVVPYNDEAVELIAYVKTNGLTAGWVRRVRPYTVSVFRDKNGNVPTFLSGVEMRLRSGKLEPAPDWFILDPTLKNYYDPEFGLKLDAHFDGIV